MIEQVRIKNNSEKNLKQQHYKTIEVSWALGLKAGHFGHLSSIKDKSNFYIKR